MHNHYFVHHAVLLHDEGCKGITYMRDGSRQSIFERVSDKKDASSGVAGSAQEREVQPARPVVPRPMMVQGATYRVQTPVGESFITINHNEQKEPFELFITIGKSGSDVAAMAEALGRMISLNLRLSGVIEPRERIRQVVSQLAGIGGARSVGFGKEKVRSLPDAVAKILAKHFDFRVNGIVEDSNKSQAVAVVNGEEGHGNGEVKKNGEVKQKEEQADVVVLQQLSLEGGAVPLGEIDTSSVSGGTNLFDICPECGVGGLAYEEGCRKCYSCGYAEC